MPIIRVSMWPRSYETKVQLAKEITETVVKITKAPPELTTVIFEDVPKESWAIAGVLCSDGRRPIGDSR